MLDPGGGGRPSEGFNPPPPPPLGAKGDMDDVAMAYREDELFGPGCEREW